jgi:hypothetical protein
MRQFEEAKPTLRQCLKEVLSGTVAALPVADQSRRGSEDGELPGNQ